MSSDFWKYLNFYKVVFVVWKSIFWCAVPFRSCSYCTELFFRFFYQEMALSWQLGSLAAWLFVEESVWLYDATRKFCLDLVGQSIGTLMCYKQTKYRNVCWPCISIT